MSPDNLERVKTETGVIVGEAIAEVTRRALVPELQPFRDALNGLLVKTNETIEGLESEVIDYKDAVDKTKIAVAELAYKVKTVDWEIEKLLEKGLRGMEMRLNEVKKRQNSNRNALLLLIVVTSLLVVGNGLVLFSDVL